MWLADVISASQNKQHTTCRLINIELVNQTISSSSSGSQTVGTSNFNLPCTRLHMFHFPPSE